MKFSVVLCSYNKTKYVKDAIKSVLNQTYQDWELIIAENSSDMRTRKAVHNMAKNDERIKVYEENHTRQERIDRCPLGDLVTKYFDMAEGDYIAFLADDDIWTSDFLEVFAGHFERNPSHKAAYCDLTYIWLTPKGDKIFSNKLINNKIFDEDDQPLYNLDGGSVVFGKECLKYIGRPYYPVFPLFDEQTRIADGLFLNKLAQFHKLYPVNHMLLKHRRTNQSTWDRFDVTRKEQLVGVGGGRLNE